MEYVSWVPIAIPSLLSIAFLLTKAGFLIWVFIRTQKIWAICYALYVVLASLANFVVPAAVSRFAYTGSVDAALSLLVISIYGAVSTLIEVVLFIGLVRSLLKSPRAIVQSPPADGV